MERLPTNPIDKWIENRIKKNKNAIIIINGPTGSGKTYVALRKAYEWAKMFGSNFSVKDNVDFKFERLLRKTMLEKNTKPGTPFVFEEVGAFGGGASSREWQSKANKFSFSFMQTTRHRQQILILTCPNFSFLEKGTRSLCHMQMEMDGIDNRQKVSYARPYAIQINARTGQFYFKYLRVKHNGRKFKFKRLEVPLPPKNVVKEYEKAKLRYTTELNNQILQESKKEQKAPTKMVVNDHKVVELMERGHNQAEIARLMGVHHRTIQRHVKKLRETKKIPIILNKQE